MKYKTKNPREATKWLADGKIMARYCNDKCISVIGFDPNLPATLLQTNYKENGEIDSEYLNPPINLTRLEDCIFYDEVYEIEFFKKDSLHLEVGKYYSTSNGDIVKIIDKTRQQGQIRFRGCIFGYRWVRTFLENGTCLRVTNRTDERFDLVKEVSLKVEEVK